MNAPATKRVRKDAVTTRVLINKTGKAILLSNRAESWLRENGYEIEADECTSRRHEDGGWEDFLPLRVFYDADALAQAEEWLGGILPAGTGRVMTDDDQQDAMAAWIASIEPATWDSWRHSPALLACFDALGAAMTPPRADFPGITAPVAGHEYEFTFRPRQRLAVVKVTGRLYRVEAGPAGEIVAQPPEEQALWSPDGDWTEEDRDAGKVWIDLTRSGTDVRGGALLTYNRNRQLVRLVVNIPC